MENPEKLVENSKNPLPGPTPENRERLPKKLGWWGRGGGEFCNFSLLLRIFHFGGFLGPAKETRVPNSYAPLAMDNLD